LFRPAVSLAKRHRTFIIKSQNDEFAKIQRLENDFSIKASLSTQHLFVGWLVEFLFCNRFYSKLIV